MMRPDSGTAAGRTEPHGDPAGPAPPARPAPGRAGGAARGGGAGAALAVRRAWPAAVGLGLGLLALGPGLGRGFLLSYDMVAVPRQPFGAAMFGLSGGPARAVPSDAVLAALSRVIPADLAQKALLLAIFMLACAGAAALLPREPWFARLAAGVFYTWNPFVAERLIIGQWALLLGYAGLPWVLRAAHDLGREPSWRGTGRLAVALLPAAVGGFAAMTISALVALPAAAFSARQSAARWRAGAIALAVIGAASLPWLIPSLLRPVYADPAGVAAFAARADTPFGSAGSVLMLGGMWNARAVPAGYGGGWSVLWLAVVLTALAGYVLLGGRRRWPGLGAAALVGLAIAGLGLTGPGQDLLRAAQALWPGFAVLRDGQQFAAPLALAEALGAGLAAAWLARRPAARPPPSDVPLMPAAQNQMAHRRACRPAARHRSACGRGGPGGAGAGGVPAARAGAAAARAGLGGGRAAAPGPVPGGLAGRGPADRLQPGRGHGAGSALGGLPEPGLERRPDHARPLAAAGVPAGDLERRAPGRAAAAAARRPGGPGAGRRDPRRRAADRRAAGGRRPVRDQRRRRGRGGGPPAGSHQGHGFAGADRIPTDG